MSLNPNRKCRPEFNNYDQSLSEEDENRDPYKTSDNEQDLDFRPPQKKPRVEGNGKEKSSKVLKQRLLKQLSAKERLNRLKQKFGGEASSTGIATAHSSNRNKVVSQNHGNIDIDNKKGPSNRPELPQSEPPVKTDPSFESYDHHFDAEEVSRGSGTKNESEIIEVIEIPSCDSQNTILNLVLELKDGMDELTSNFKLLRKQMTRLEMKSFGSPRGPAASKSEYEMSIQPELLLDFDSALAREGLPVTTCVGLNEFELKLRQDDKYREKLVSLLSIIHGNNGDKTGSKIVKSVFDTVIDSKLQSLFTWTGKSGNGHTKMAFKEFDGVVKLLHAVIRLADTAYTLSDCKTGIIYQVLKHACTKQKSKNEIDVVSAEERDSKSITIDLGSTSNDSVPINSQNKFINNQTDNQLVDTILKLINRCKE